MSDAGSTVQVLFICTGNTCRSPLAAAALAAELAGETERVSVGSAGTSAVEGQGASRGSIEVAAGDGIDLREHRSHRVTPAMLRTADLIFVMEPQHRVALESLGAPADRVHVLSEWPAPGEPDLPVSDPFGASREAYEECWRRIRRHVQRILPSVRQALRSRSES